MAFSLHALFAICLGAAFGAAGRYGAMVLLHGTGYGILAANALGGFLAGIYFFYGTPHPTPWHLFLVVGFLGSLTTLSGITLEMMALFQQNLYIKSLQVMLTHNVLALLLTFIGFVLARTCLKVWQ